MAQAQRRSTTLENVPLMFRNFAGEARQFNDEGKRNFHIFLEPEVAEAMARDGWNVKNLKPKDEDDLVGQAHLKVLVNFKGRPPQIYMVTSKKKTKLDEDTVMLLDTADIIRADVTINQYEFDPQGQPGKFTAYCDVLYATIRESELDMKYDELPDAIAG
jgi:hypothetical protein